MEDGGNGKKIILNKKQELNLGTSGVHLGRPRNDCGHVNVSTHMVGLTHYLENIHNPFEWT